MKVAKKKQPSNNRRSQFNIQASGLSDKAYLFVEALSTKKELSQKFWEWAEREVNGDYPEKNAPTVQQKQLEQQVNVLTQQIQMMMGQMQQGMMGYPQQMPYPSQNGQYGYMATQPQHQGQHQGQHHPYPTYQQQPPMVNQYASAPKPTFGMEAKPKPVMKKEKYMSNVSEEVNSSEIDEETDYDY